MDYQELYESFKENAQYEEDPRQPFFETASSEELAVLEDLFETCAANTAVWTPQELEELKNWKIPEQVLRFYQQMNPVNAPMNDAGVELCDLERILEESTQLEPGCYLIRFGFLVIASTVGGNPVLLDLQDPDRAVFLCEHQLLQQEQEDGKSVLYFVFPSEELREEYGNEIPVNRETLLKSMVPVEKSFEAFLKKLSEDAYEEDLEDLLD